MDTRRKGLIASVIFCILVIAIAYFAWVTIHVKTELLAEEERWQILDADYDGDYTIITIKYLGENDAKNIDIGTECLSSTGTKYIEWGIDAPTFSKSETQTVTARDYVYTLTISWQVGYGDDYVSAKLDVLSFDRFPG